VIAVGMTLKNDNCLYELVLPLKIYYRIMMGLKIVLKVLGPERSRPVWQYGQDLVRTLFLAYRELSSGCVLK
jgi:hypothetical protein